MMLQPHATSVWFHSSISPSVRLTCYFHTSFVTTWLMSGITKHSFPPFPINSLSLQHQGPPSPDPTARHSPYRCHSSESLDYLSGLMPKALSPAPYFPSGAGTVSRPSFTTVSSAGIGGCVSPSASPVTVSALSHYSSSTAGLLEELQICSLDSPGASPTPSPTLSHASTYTTTAGPDDVLTTFVASTAAAASVTNVIIPTSHCCNTHHYQKQMVPSLPLTHLDGWTKLSQNVLLLPIFYISLTFNYNVMFPYHVNVSALMRTLFLCACLCFSVMSFLQSNAFILSLKASPYQKFTTRQNHFKRSCSRVKLEAVGCWFYNVSYVRTVVMFPVSSLYCSGDRLKGPCYRMVHLYDIHFHVHLVFPVLITTDNETCHFLRATLFSLTLVTC